MMRIFKLIVIGILLACAALILGYQHGVNKAEAEWDAQVKHDAREMAKVIRGAR